MINVYVLCGGKSVEHEVSLLTASAIINSLDKERYNVYPVYITKEGLWCNKGLVTDEIKDTNELKGVSNKTILGSMAESLDEIAKNEEKSIIFPALHGTNGEDGTIQGFLDLIDLPYVGNGVMSSAVGLDKVITKELFSKVNIPQTKHIAFSKKEWIENKDYLYSNLEDVTGYPCYVKPSRSGSSVGINRCVNKEELEQAINEAFLYDTKLVIEEEVVGREMQISVVGNNAPKSSVIGEFIQERNFMDYDAKYLDGKLIQVIPARVSEEITEQMREAAVRAFKALDCSGLVRVDYFVTNEDKFYVNEVNTMPGFTKLSMTPVLWEKTDGTTYSQLVERLIKLGFQRYEERKALLYDRRTK
ncbi:D-alanine--D-alanine ligase [Sporosalibacterium faouarense]|uniref:D-alanine--D-alanine ligase n=1 Tax=Sporosalibacterium faouarense TaxID=516123 RepID=UPI001A9C41DD|nr:D-alanine--D-alanine ligase [Sporosalibacterium faouarense]